MVILIVIECAFDILRKVENLIVSKSETVPVAVILAVPDIIVSLRGEGTVSVEGCEYPDSGAVG